MKKTLLICFLVFQVIFADNNDIPDLYRTSLYTYAGVPITAEDGPEFKVLVNSLYAVGYSEVFLNPLWAVYRFGNMQNEIDPGKWERPDRFRVDLRTEARVKHEDYTSSGYQRGHMAPDAAMLFQYGQMGKLETYLMSNICPQKASLNAGIWSKLEKKIRVELSQDDTPNKQVHDLFVIAGPIFDTTPPDTLASGVSVPTRFYKILAYRRGYLGTIKAVALIFPQQPTSGELMDYVATIDEIEELTGLNFFSELSKTKQKNLESVKRDFLHDIIED